MKKAIYIRFLLPLMTAIIICGIFSAIVIDYNVQKGIEREMINTLSLISRNSDLIGDKTELAKKFSADCYGYRITLIDANGTVLGDSQADLTQMDNHSDRKEFEQSLENGTSVSKRYSKTMKTNMIYVAQRVNDNFVIRVSVPMHTINQFVYSQYPVLLIGILAAMLFGLILTIRLTKSLIMPISQISDGIQHIDRGDYNFKLPDQKYEELNSLVVLIQTLSQNVSQNLVLIEEEKQKLGFLLDNIRQGIILVDHKMNIVQFNRSAKMILNKEGNILKQSLVYLTRDPQILSAVENCIQHKKSSIFDIEMEDKGLIFSVSINVVDSQWIKDGAIIVITDVTDARKSEQIRREFIANASHELKTPITSVKGFAELLSSNLVEDPKKVDDYLQRILFEADRMTSLISDILKLSAIEENNQIKNMDRVDIGEVIDEVIKTTVQLTEEKNISLSANCASDTLYVYADKDDILRMLLNLVVNAIKYNRENGSVTVSGKKQGLKCVIEVADTGIGIPEKDITRVFERFYTVDKGRSASVGGTGLGLSIVKHIVAFYDGEINIKSKEQVGTVITVKLNLSNQELPIKKTDY